MYFTVNELRTLQASVRDRRWKYEAKGDSNLLPKDMRAACEAEVENCIFLEKKLELMIYPPEEISEEEI